MRHRVSIRDGFILVLITLAATFYAFEFDVFHGENQATTHRLKLELDEILALGGLFIAGLLVFSLRRLSEQRRETGRRLAAEREARVLAYQDPLTGLPNRRQFEEALTAALAAPPGADGVHGVFMMDLNGFKRINDIHGHPVGDEVLIHVANRLSQAVRHGDVVARLGGDEFAILAHHLSGPEAATGLALRIIDGLTAPITVGSNQHQVGVAVGIALAPRDADTREEILRKADIAQYRAKAEGRSALSFFEEQMDAQVRERDRLERALRAAIGSDRLRPFYQPLIDLKSGDIIGFEALARWTDPVLGEIEPARFIPLAEDVGLIGPLTDDLLARACRDAVQWPTKLTLSFNISPGQLHDKTLGLRVLAILAEAGLAPQRLEIEITESALVRDMEAAQAILGSLREAGIRIALDDFGTGYSSLYHLRNFKLDKIKIDRSFIESMAFDKESAAIVKALIGLGSGLSLTVTAEGVEDTAQQALLAAQGCTQGQGFLYSRALPAAEALALVAPVGKRRSARRA